MDDNFNNIPEEDKPLENDVNEAQSAEPEAESTGTANTADDDLDDGTSYHFTAKENPNSTDYYTTKSTSESAEAGAQSASQQAGDGAQSNAGQNTYSGQYNTGYNANQNQYSQGGYNQYGANNGYNANNGQYGANNAYGGQYGGSTYYTPPQNNANAGAYNAQQGTTTTDEQKPDKPKKPKKKINKTVLIAIIVVAVCAIIAGIGIAVASSSGSSDDDSSSDSSTSSSAQVETEDQAEVETTDSDGNYTVAGVAENCIDSCVGITVYTTSSSDAYSYFYGYGSDDGSSDEEEESGVGSGILMLEGDGVTYVMTCAHVISDATSYTVTLNDGTEYEATLVGYDSQTDIGVLSIEATGLQIATFADSSTTVVGEQVVAIGCPGGLEFMNSVTSGYVSALDRPVSSSIGYDNDCIQTDAAINPGNSGGALFNMQGQVIGVNSSKIASTEYEGMGFAVPSNTAVEVANSLIENGYVAGRAKLGITYTALTSYSNSSAILSALEELGFEDAEGTMVISEVSEDSDLYDKDIQQYDMIVAVNGETMTSTDIMTSLLADSSPGDTVTLTIARISNGSIDTFEIECTLVESTE